MGWRFFFFFNNIVYKGNNPSLMLEFIRVA